MPTLTGLIQSATVCHRLREKKMRRKCQLVLSGARKHNRLLGRTAASPMPRNAARGAPAAKRPRRTLGRRLSLSGRSMLRPISVRQTKGEKFVLV